jgi:Fic family protein
MKKMWEPSTIPLNVELETKPVMKQAAAAHRFLAELKGVSRSIPNQDILISTLSLQEAKDSSAVENVITTQDEMYKIELMVDHIASGSTKEVSRYACALRRGFAQVRAKNLITMNDILDMQAELKLNRSGFRKMPGTELKNVANGDTVYIPPQDHETIIRLMQNLEKYINDDSLSDVDPLVKMAVIHFQFESIHPFYDGNGRTGRILNILYMVLKDLLDLPILYLSRYIIQTKADYYRLLQHVRDTGEWEPWVLYMLKGIEVTSRQTIQTIQEMQKLMLDYKHRIRDQFRFYSQDLLNNLFRHPYTKIEFLKDDLKITRLTATKYLDRLVAEKFLEKHKIGRTYFYVNRPLFDLLANASEK